MAVIVEIVHGGGGDGVRNIVLVHFRFRIVSDFGLGGKKLVVYHIKWMNSYLYSHCIIYHLY